MLGALGKRKRKKEVGRESERERKRDRDRETFQNDFLTFGNLTPIIYKHVLHDPVKLVCSSNHWTYLYLSLLHNSLSLISNCHVSFLIQMWYFLWSNYPSWNWPFFFSLLNFGNLNLLLENTTQEIKLERKKLT